MALRPTDLLGHGNPGYRVSHYDLELSTKPATGRLSARARLTVVASAARSGARAGLRAVAGRAGARGRQAGAVDAPRRQAARPRPVPRGHAVRRSRSGTPGGPTPVRTRYWGEVGWDELADGVIVASQPIGAPSWFPCNDLVGAKATYRIEVTAPAAYTVVANGVLAARTAGGSTTTWTYAADEPMAAYLATVQIGPYEQWLVTRGQSWPCRGPGAGRPARLRPPAGDDGRVHRAVRAVPVRGVRGGGDRGRAGGAGRGAGPVDLRREPRRRAKRDTSGWSRTSWRTSGSATASDSRTGSTSGSTRASRRTRSGCGRSGPAARPPRRWPAARGRCCPGCRRTCSSATRPPATCSTTACTSVAR